MVRTTCWKDLLLGGGEGQEGGRKRDEDYEWVGLDEELQ